MDDTEPQTAAAKVLVRYRPVTTGRSAAGSAGAAQALDCQGIPC
jgi:hypothetical protein